MNFKNFVRIVIILLIITVLALIYVAKVCAVEYIEPQEAIIMSFDHIMTTFNAEMTILDEPECIIGEIEYLTYTDEELELLAHLIFAEAGSDWCNDTMQQYVGSVVLNRIDSRYFPNTMYDVIYQSGQYSCTWNGGINKTPNERAYNVARYLLENGSVLPKEVVFQAQFMQGDGLYELVQNMYFCYKY